MNNKMDIKIGDEIPAVVKRANEGTSEDAWPVGSPHRSDSAQGLGLKGSIVTGLILIGHFNEMLVNFFGKEWYTKGKINIKFIGGGVFHGDMITVRGIVREKSFEKDGIRIGLEIWMEKQDGTKTAVGTVSCIMNSAG